MSFLKFKPTGLVAVVTLGLCAQLVPGTLEAQRGLRLGQPGALIGGSDVAGSVLDNAEEMDLTPGQVERLEALQANSEARVGAAREQLEGWRAELPMIREASESIRSDVRATMAELRTILTVAQMRELGRLSPERYRALRGGGPEWRRLRGDRSLRARGWSAQLRRGRGRR